MQRCDQVLECTQMKRKDSNIYWSCVDEQLAFLNSLLRQKEQDDCLDEDTQALINGVFNPEGVKEQKTSSTPKPEYESIDKIDATTRALNIERHRMRVQNIALEKELDIELPPIGKRLQFIIPESEEDSENNDYKLIDNKENWSQRQQFQQKSYSSNNEERQTEERNTDRNSPNSNETPKLLFLNSLTQKRSD